MADELVRMWRASYEQALAPYRDPHTIAEQTRFLLEDLAPRAVLTVALRDNLIVGFMAQQGVEIEQLYVHVGHQGAGLGRAFLAIARERSPHQLHLFTFQRNLRARQFYRRQGFTEVAFGHRNQEGLADVELVWRETVELNPVRAESSPAHR